MQVIYKINLTSIYKYNFVVLCVSLGLNKSIPNFARANLFRAKNNLQKLSKQHIYMLYLNDSLALAAYMNDVLNCKWSLISVTFFHFIYWAITL